eukprot:CAMPEP_0195527838 /NCGR_PEP_ID=MMETSP0794_2-20130614/29751_1 /TAXON_ID=515487 /ORGANISM="Stephanopyxis turris, Strain CCMP 815" /LENGTH=363 /DNA_ID=CAMNT_0040658843 /DNA_START=27 /DNA_END=1115 /DNA_ORIENTATION=+
MEEVKTIDDQTHGTERPTLPGKHEHGKSDHTIKTYSDSSGSSRYLDEPNDRQKNPNRQNQRRQNIRRRNICLQVSLCCIILAAVISVALVLVYYFRDDSIPNPNSENSPQALFSHFPPEALSRLVRAYDMVSTVSDESALNDTKSPQYRALKWIVEEDSSFISEAKEVFIQRYVLALLFYATKGENWIEKMGFLSAEHECQWHDNNNYGVFACDSDSRVVGLRLSSNNLTGPIPPEIGQLTRLKRLFLWGNNIGGPIPTQIGELRHLTNLQLYENNLVGVIPPEIGRLISLLEVDLHSNSIRGEIPAELGNLHNLNKFDLDTNRLSGVVPTTLGSLKHLDVFDIHNNNISGDMDYMCFLGISW